MVEHRHQGADQDDGCRDVEGEDEAAKHVVADLAALVHGDAAVDERGAGPGEFLELADALPHQLEKPRHRPHVKDQHGDDHLQRDAAENEPEVDLGAIVGEQNGNAEDEGDTNQAL